MTLLDRARQVIEEGAAAAEKITTPPQPVAPLDLRALAARHAPPREWAIDQWAPKHAPVLLAGLGGSGKSLLSQQTATAQALGVDFIGKVGEPTSVMFWACEDPEDELWRRQEAISSHFGVPLDEPAGRLHIVSRSGRDNTLMAPLMRTSVLAPTNVMEELRQQVNDLRVSALWLDNVAHLFAGNPDDRNQVTSFVNQLMGMVTDRPLSIVLVTHTARAQGSEYAGSAAWENACRARWYFGTRLPEQKVGDDETVDQTIRYLARRKSNYSALDHLRMTLVGGVLVPDAPAGHIAGQMAAVDERRAEQVTLAAFKTLKERGINPTDGRTAADYLPTRALALGLGCGYSKHEIERAMNRLMSRGTFIRGEVGTYANRGKRFGLVLVEG